MPVEDYRQVDACEATARTELEAALAKVRDLEARLDKRERMQAARAAVDYMISVEKKYPPLMRTMLIELCATKEEIASSKSTTTAARQSWPTSSTADGSRPPQDPL